MEHCMNLNSVTLVNYVVKRCQDKYIDIYLDSEYMRNYILAIHQDETIQVLKAMCNNSIYLNINPRFKNGDISPERNFEEIKVQKFDEVGKSPKVSFRNSTNLNDIELSMHREISRQRSRKLTINTLTNKLNINSQVKRTNTVMNRALNSATKILEKSDLTEMILQDYQQEDDEVYETIIALYEDLLRKDIPNKQLFNLLILYERIELFDKIVSHCNNVLESGKYGYIDEDAITEYDSYSDDPGNTEFIDHKQDSIYDYDEIISDAFSYSISSNKLNVTFYLFKNYKRSIFGNKDACIISITSSIRNEIQQNNRPYFLNERLFILLNMTKYMDYSECFDLFNVIEEIIEEKAENNFLVYNTNPLKIIVMLTLICKKLISKHAMLKFKGINIIKNLCSCANQLILYTSNLKEVEDLLFDQMYSGVKILDLLANHDIKDILKNPLIDNVVTNLHCGTYLLNSILEHSITYAVVNKRLFDDVDESSSLQKRHVTIFRDDKNIDKGRAKSSNLCQRMSKNMCQRKSELKCIHRRRNQIEGHMFKFEVWKKSPETKHIVETIVIFSIGCLMVYFANEFLDSANEASLINEKITAIENGTSSDDLDEEYRELESVSYTFYEDILTLLLLNICTSGYLIKNIQEIIYSNARHVTFNALSLEVLLNMASFVLITYWGCKHWVEYVDVSADVRNEKREYQIVQNMEDDNVFSVHLLTAILVAIQFLRFIVALRLNRLFGPMSKTVGSMIIDVGKFLLLFFSIFILFQAAGMLLFTELPEYKEFDDAFNTLFAASLANYDYTIYENLTDVDPIFGYIFITCFVLASGILLLNFLIAILSTTYGEMEDQKNAMYVKAVIKHLKKYEYNKYYSSIVSSVVPLNIFFLPICPLVVLLKSEKLNEVLLHIQYLPVAFCSVLLFFVISLVLLPFAYGFLIIEKFRVMLKCSRSESFAPPLKRILDFITFAALGTVMLLVLCFVDTFHFALNLYATDLKLINEDQEKFLKARNTLMDGSIKTERVKSIQVLVRFKTINRKAKYKTSVKNVINPVRDGLSLTVVKILKVTLIRLLSNHLRLCLQGHHLGKDRMFIPVNHVINEMFRKMIIHEQLNSIILGPTYQKDKEFFYSTEFDELIEELVQYYDPYLLQNDDEDDELQSQDTKMRKYINFDYLTKCKLWDEKITEFLLRSNERWLLDQFKLVKHFLLQNSIECNITSLVHPLYNYYDQIGKLKSNYNRYKGVGDSEIQHAKRNDVDQFSDVSASENLSSTHMSTSEHEIRASDFKLRKCDILALVQSIEEIENYLKLQYILNKSSLADEEAPLQEDESVPEYEEYLRTQYSILNFNRNYKAVQRHLSETHSSFSQ